MDPPALDPPSLLLSASRTQEHLPFPPQLSNTLCCPWPYLHITGYCHKPDSETFLEVKGLEKQCDYVREIPQDLYVMLAVCFLCKTYCLRPSGSTKLAEQLHVGQGKS